MIFWKVMGLAVWAFMVRNLKMKHLNSNMMCQGFYQWQTVDSKKKKKKNFNNIKFFSFRNTNGCQFCKNLTHNFFFFDWFFPLFFFIKVIICAPCDWLDNKHVIFGRIIDEMRIVRMIENVPVGHGNKPKSKCIITECGELWKKIIFWFGYLLKKKKNHFFYSIHKQFISFLFFSL